MAICSPACGTPPPVGIGRAGPRAAGSVGAPTEAFSRRAAGFSLPSIRFFTPGFSKTRIFQREALRISV